MTCPYCAGTDQKQHEIRLSLYKGNEVFYITFECENCGREYYRLFKCEPLVTLNDKGEEIKSQKT